ncbi:MAG TPA: DUF2127 domain-containing protein [Gemmatimonadales bacterium]|nr:DUF2127 domain-containing protein [Gemmatimonadales bacterium]
MGLRIIAVYKFCKAALLLVVGLGVLQLLQPGVAAGAQRWIDAIASSSDRRVVQHLLGLITGSSPQRLVLVAAGALLYTVLFTVEGAGLWLGRRWAAYLTVLSTALLLPVEVYALARHVSAPRAATFVVNLAVVAYLIRHLRTGHSHTESYG